ncbi:MAG: hypothetical protein K8U57_07200 [Planctomycetes bacterium]|nr:hypothetical protein [Planctomycetota bacterium]
MFTAPVLALLLVAQPSDTHTLQWKLKEGDVFYNKSSVTMDQTMEFMGQKVEQTVGIKTILKFKVKSAKAGETVVDMTYLEMKVDAGNLPGGNAADNLKNVSFTATLNDKMQVTKLEGYDKFLDALAGDNAEQKKLMKAMMPLSAIKQMFSQTFVVGPGKPIAVGGTWDRQMAVAFGPIGNVETKEAFKLDSVKGDLATMTTKGELTFKAGDGDSGLPFKITKSDLKADKFAGSHTFDMKIGRITGSKVDMDMSGSMTIEVAGKSIDANLTMKVKTVSVITDKNPIVD